MMLKSVVQHDDLRVEGRDGMMPNYATVTANEYGNARRMRRKNERLVA